MLDTFRFSERFLSFKSQISLLWTETVTTGQFMFGCPCFECGACNIWSALTEIKYTLHVSILQVYLYMCFSGEKSIRSIIHLQFKTSIKLIEYINGKCISFILHILKCTLSILLQTSVLVKKFSQRKVYFTISYILKKLKTAWEYYMLVSIQNKSILIKVS